MDFVTKKIKELIDSKGIKPYRVEKDLGITKSKLLKYLQDFRSIPVDILIPVCRYLGMSEGEIFHLIMGKEPNFETAFAGVEGDYDNVREVTEGGWDDVKRLVQKNNMGVHIFQVIGDSMAPTLWNDDILFAIEHEKHKDEIRNTYIYVIESLKHKSLFIKRITDREDGTIKLYSDNRTMESSLLLNLRTEVGSMWRVRTKMTWQLGAPTFNVNILENIEHRLSSIERSIQKIN